MSNDTNQLTFREDGCILIRNCRLSYPHLFKAWSKNPDKDKAKFSGRFLLDKKTHAAEIKSLQQHLAKLMQEHFKGRIPLDKLFLRDGAGTAKPEQEDSWFIAASEDRKPDVIHRDPKIKVSEEDDIVYAGCFVNVLIRPWVQSNVHGKRINANLLAVQFVKDGDRFGAERPDAGEAFGDISGEFEDDGAGDASGFDDEGAFD